MMAQRDTALRALLNAFSIDRLPGFSFFQPGPNDEWLVVFDNVVRTDNMSCNGVAGHEIGFTNNLWDDLNAAGADLSCVSHVACWIDSNAGVSHCFSNAGGLLTFDGFPIIPARPQIIVELTVIPDDSPTNAPGTQFVNTAKWDFDTFEVETQ